MSDEEHKPNSTLEAIKALFLGRGWTEVPPPEGSPSEPPTNPTKH